MTLLRYIGLPLLTILIATQAIGAELLDNRELCMQIEKFARDVPLGTSRSVQVSIAHGVGTFLGLECRPVPMKEPGLSFCRYLAEHSSREALGGNIMHMSSCILASTFPAPKKDISIDSLAGQLTVSGRYDAYPNVDVELEYAYDRRGRQTDFMRVTATGVSNTD